MVCSAFLVILLVASALLVQTHAALASSSSSPMTLADLHKRAHGDKKGSGTSSSSSTESPAVTDFDDRVQFQSQGHATSIDQTANIAINMQMGLPFYGLWVKDRVPGTDDSSSYIIGDESNFDTYGDGALAQAKSCLKAAQPTVMKAMAKCPAKTCQSDFVIDTYFGTAAGMDWTKDGLLLYQCVAFQTDKSQCANPKKGPCKLTILGEFHKQMLQKSNLLAVIGSGALSLSQMGQQIVAYNKAHGTTLSPPTGGHRKRGEMRRMVEGGGELESS